MPLVLPVSAPVWPFAAPTIGDALIRLRQDIFDQAGPSPRWQDSDLQRAIDRAVDQYSFVAPWSRTALIPAIGGSRLYAIPNGPGGPTWWVEAVEYPTGQYPRLYLPFQEMVQPNLGTPGAPTASAAGAAGPLAGAYLYRVSFLGVSGETLAGPSSAPLTLAGGQALLILPLGPAPYCLGRNLYRTPANGADGSQLLVATIGDNTSTSYQDGMLDSALGAPLPAADTTANAPLVELRISDLRLPDPTNPGSLAISYAGKHVWNDGGATIPEQHHDVVLLGAAAFACLANQVPTNDLFDYQDGELRDRVSEVKTPEHWLAAGGNLLARFKERLEEVKQQRDAAYAATTQWGNVGSRWQWT
ncbi:MAG TPA: hypothetical protein VNL71_00300 [Chloroflexota bacterium]|nr:hypothetical protein [Chloroflexota bacterium]